MKTRTTQDTVLILAVAASLVLVNVLAANLVWRADLTADKRYTLAPATLAVIGRLSDPVTIRAYFTKNLPFPQSSIYDYTRDLLAEYNSRSGGRVRFEFIDPQAEEDAADHETRQQVQTDIFGRAVRPPTKIEEELELLGIPPVKIRVSQDDKLELRRAYLGLDIRYGEKREAIPVVQDIGKLEYQITTLVRKMTRPKSPQIALLSGHGGPSFNDRLAKAHAILSEQFQLVPLDLSQKAEIPAEVDLLLVVGPRTALSEAEKMAIDRHVLAGKPAALLLDAFDVDLRSFGHQITAHGLGDLLGRWGVTIEPGLVGDIECASFQIQRRLGFLIVPEPVQYPYMPLVRSWPIGSPITHELGPVPLAFASALRYAPTEGSSLTHTVLASSSARSWLEVGADDEAAADPSAPPQVDLNPLQDWSQRTIKPDGPHVLALTLQGRFPAVYAADRDTPRAPARVALFGTSAFAQDQFLDQSSIALLLNTFDWLLADDELLAMRARGLSVAPLDTEIAPATKTAYKVLNVAGPPVLLVLFGLGRWRWRTARRQRFAAPAA